MKCAIGQDSHRFTKDENKPLILAGLEIKGHLGFEANSDGDVLYHALTNAISGITSVNILGPIADKMCKAGIKNSDAYVKEALKYLEDPILHLSFILECKTPKLAPYIDEMKKNISELLNIDKKNVGITATSGEGLTPFGQGLGIMCFCLITTG